MHCEEKARHRIGMGYGDGALTERTQYPSPGKRRMNVLMWDIGN